MPAKTAKQYGFMQLCANNPEKARGKCPPRSVAKEYVKETGSKLRKKFSRSTRRG